MRGTASLANCNLLIKGFGIAVDGDACTGTAQRGGGDGVGFPLCGGANGSTRCGSNEVWLEKVVSEQVRPSYQKDFGSLHPLLTRRKTCVTGDFFSLVELWRNAALKNSDVEPRADAELGGTGGSQQTKR